MGCINHLVDTEQNEKAPAWAPAGGEAHMHEKETSKRPPGVCIPWEEKLKELPPISGDAELFQRIWEANDALAYTYIWQVLLSF